jgi:DedD protein
MAFFKFRVNHQDDLNSSATQAQSMEVLRQRVRHRLIGSAILVLIAVIGFPLIFDTQPRPVALDVAIDIPDKAHVATQTPPTPLNNATQPKAQTSDDAAIQGVAPIGQDAQSADSQNDSPKSKAQPLNASPSVNSNVASVVAAPAASDANSNHIKDVSSISPSKSSKSLEKEQSASVKAGLAPQEVIVSSSSNASKDSEPAVKENVGVQNSKDKKEGEKNKSDSARFVIQVGAFNDDLKVKEIRDKLEKASLHTFTQVVTVKESKKTRIRLGPFASKEEANHVLAKVHALGYNPSLITLP